MDGLNSPTTSVASERVWYVCLVKRAIPARIRHGRREQEALRSERSSSVILILYRTIYRRYSFELFIYIYVYIFSLFCLWEQNFLAQCVFASFFFFFFHFQNGFIQNLVQSSLKLEQFTSVNAGTIFVCLQRNGEYKEWRNCYTCFQGDRYLLALPIERE